MLSGRKAFTGFKSLAQLDENTNPSEESQIQGFPVCVVPKYKSNIFPKYLLSPKTPLIHFLKTLIWILIIDQR